MKHLKFAHKTLTVQSIGNWVREVGPMPLLIVAQTCTKSNEIKFQLILIIFLSKIRLFAIRSPYLEYTYNKSI